MIRRAFRLGLTFGILAAIAYAVMRLLEPRPPAQPSAAPARHEPWPALASDPARPEAPSTHLRPDPGAPVSGGPAPWVEPVDGNCPASHPVKAKLGSKIFHLPGMANYERTRADRCYLDAAHAEADGLRAAKR